MLDDLTRSVKEAVSDAAVTPETTTASGFFDNIKERFKGRLIFSLIFFLVFAGVAVFVILMILFFVLRAI